MTLHQLIFVILTGFAIAYLAIGVWLWFCFMGGWNALHFDITPKHRPFSWRYFYDAFRREPKESLVMLPLVAALWLPAFLHRG